MFPFLVYEMDGIIIKPFKQWHKILRDIWQWKTASLTSKLLCLKLHPVSSYRELKMAADQPSGGFLWTGHFVPSSQSPVTLLSSPLFSMEILASFHLSCYLSFFFSFFYHKQQKPQWLFSHESVNFIHSTRNLERGPSGLEHWLQCQRASLLLSCFNILPV